MKKHARGNRGLDEEDQDVRGTEHGLEESTSLTRPENDEAQECLSVLEMLCCTCGHIYAISTYHKALSAKKTTVSRSRASRSNLRQQILDSATLTIHWFSIDKEANSEQAYPHLSFTDDFFQVFETVHL